MSKCAWQITCPPKQQNHSPTLATTTMAGHASIQQLSPSSCRPINNTIAGHIRILPLRRQRHHRHSRSTKARTHRRRFVPSTIDIKSCRCEFTTPHLPIAIRCEITTAIKFVRLHQPPRLCPFVRGNKAALLLLQQCNIAINSTADLPIYTSITQNLQKTNITINLDGVFPSIAIVPVSSTRAEVLSCTLVCVSSPVYRISSPVYPRRSLVGIA